jgi:hypothetical protein
MTTTKQALAKALTFFSVPEGEGRMTYTMTYTVYTDGSIALPGDLTSEQIQAITAYVTYENRHMREKHGNSLREMSEEENALYEAAIETLKSPEQQRRETVERFTLAHHASTKHAPQVSWFEEITSEETKQEFAREREIPSLDWRVYEVHICETYQHSSFIQTEYYIAENPATHEFRVISAWCKFYPDEEEEEG